MATPTCVFVGPREAMIAEVAAWDPVQIGIKPADCKWLVMPYGDAQWDTEWFRTKREALAHARYVAEQMHVKVATV